MLLRAAAAQWKTEPAKLPRRERLRHRIGKQTLTYGELAEAAMKLPAAGEA